MFYRWTVYSKGRVIAPLFAMVALALGFAVGTVRADSAWSVFEDCAPEEQPRPPDPWAFGGIIVMYQPGEGVRALRADVPTTYYIAFDAGGFARGASLSPDGAWVAVPHGYFLTVSTSDVRYRVNEMRVYSTERVPRLRRVFAWSASFQAINGAGIEPVRWQDDTTLIYPRGGIDTPYTDYAVAFLEDTIREQDNPPPVGLSPDGTHRIQRVEDTLAITTADDNTLLDRLEGAIFAMWQPQAPRAYMALIRSGSVWRLAWHDLTDGTYTDVFTLPEGVVLRDFAWSPTGEGFAFTLYDPQEDVNRLHIGDVTARTVRDTCLDLAPPVSPSNLVWSPEGDALALNLREGVYGRVQVYDLARGERVALAGYSGGFIGWGRGDMP